MKKLFLVTALATLATTAFGATGQVIEEMAATGVTTANIPITVEGKVVDNTGKRLVVTFDNSDTPNGTAFRFILPDAVFGETVRATAKYTAKVVEGADETPASAAIYGGLSQNGAAVAKTATSTVLTNGSIAYDVTGIALTKGAASTDPVTGNLNVTLTAPSATAGSYSDNSVSLKISAE